jgi:hypothetical protein
MKYFTPELYVQGNSPDEDVADAAHEAWERAIKRYRRHYKKIEPLLPESVQRFHQQRCLHDADVLGPAELTVPSLPWSAKDIVLVVQNENTLIPEDLHTLMFLRYAVVEEPRVEIPLPSSAFHDGQPIWLYDELDVLAPGDYSHEILLSNGRVITLRFQEFSLHVAKLVAPYKALNLQNAQQGQAVSA